MDSVGTYATSTAAWLSLQAIPLLISPKLIVTMLSPDARRPTDLEIYLSRTLSMTLLCLGLLTILLAGLLPLSTPVAESENSHAPSPYSGPTIFLTTTFHVSSTIYMYTNYMATGSACFALGMTGSGILSCFGLWCLMFGGGDGRGKVSGWPFRNDEERTRKKEKMMKRRGL
ncbi:hypothetical protein HO173_005084 [Letharia columbiana]|uniref:Uncharacterized protein n=1 Tax=Letharia columbiana TaxID=112416 RepID=A0A8H6FXX6_9LECA|nr:uncharacterized protein HO173_005084 [Letharia columbiana]KAF6236793.1 hypothetical protein HO173_005084 [Letharia columbiana]